MQLRAVPSPGAPVLDPVTVPAGATLVDVPFTGPEKPASIVLEGVAGGVVLGRTHPISLDNSSRTAAKVVTDEN